MLRTVLRTIVLSSGQRSPGRQAYGRGGKQIAHLRLNGRKTAIFYAHLRQ